MDVLEILGGIIEFIDIGAGEWRLRRSNNETVKLIVEPDITIKAGEATIEGTFLPEDEMSAGGHSGSLFQVRNIKQ